MKKSPIIHPFLFAIFPILFLMWYNLGEVSFSDIMLSLITALGFTALLVLFLNSAVKDTKKGGLIASVFLVLFFSYGRVYDLIQDWQLGNFIIGRHRYLMFTWGLIFGLGAYFIIRTRRYLHNLTVILNSAVFLLVTVSVVNILIYKFRIKDNWEDAKSAQGTVTNRKEPGNLTTLRDIYYIILDGYASSDTLEKVFDYDNNGFTDYLVKKGFYVAFESRTNYVTTFLSLASSLNMEYVNYLSDKVGIETEDRRTAYRMIRNNKVMNFLKSKGYKFIHFSSGWGATDHNKYADLEFKCATLNEFLIVLIETTMLRPFESYFIKDDVRGRILCTFSKFAAIPNIKGPKFIFAHIVCPHPPYVFGANGELVPETEIKIGGYAAWGQKEKYLNQLNFISKKVKDVVNEILSNSDIPPVIILQSDHGSMLTFSHADSAEDKPTENMLKEKTQIFNAYYLPLGGSSLLYESITPVNTFRLIFNFYFDTDYELLDDQSYYSTSKHPYRFTNVTEKVKYY